MAPPSFALQNYMTLTSDVGVRIKARLAATPVIDVSYSEGVAGSSTCELSKPDNAGEREPDNSGLNSMKTHPTERASNAAAHTSAVQERSESTQRKTSPQLISWEEVIGER